MASKLEERITVPEHVDISLDEGVLKVKGKCGEVTARFAYPQIIVKKDGNSIVITSSRTTKKYKRMLYTFEAHIKNMLRGVNNNYVYKMKICSGHFPMTVKVEKDFLVISNFLGEKIPRRAHILDSAKVVVSGDIITVTSVDIDKAGQTAANIETATKIRNRDRRVFQDGIYMTERI